MKTKSAVTILTTATMVLLGGAALPSSADDTGARVQAVMKSSFVTSGIADVSRLQQDEVQRTCTALAGKAVPPEVARKLEQQQMAEIAMPKVADPKELLGDWRAGEKIAQDGKGLTFTDKPGEASGGNCYACHQLAPAEISYGNIGPSLYQYGKLRGLNREIIEYTYKKIYNAQAYNACSNMPRFGHQKILTEAQIRDVLALLLDPQSPVNK